MIVYKSELINKNILTYIHYNNYSQKNVISKPNICRKEQNRKLKTNLCPTQTHPLCRKVLLLW